MSSPNPKATSTRASTQGERFDADYELPFLAHATMEPMNCTVRLTPGACEIWTGTQVQSRCQEYAAKAAGLPIDKVTVNNHYLGGGFGRRLEPDMVESAVRIAKEVSTPIKVVWTREEDMQHDVYRPVYRDTISASLSNGKIVAWKYKVTGSSVLARWLPPAFQNGIDGDAVDSAVDMPYDIPNKRVEYVRAEPPGVTTGFWRGVGPNNNVFAIESFMDELARKANMDPVAFRLGMLDGTPRLKAALKLVAEKSGWGSPLPARVGRGVCAQPSFGSFIATVVEAEVDDVGGVHLRRVTCAVDTGIAVNPDTVMAQLQGGLIFGLTAALWGEVTIEKGRVQQSNFNDYRMLRIDETPPIDVHVIKSAEHPGGIGETGATAGPPALRNAIYAATGVAPAPPADRSRRHCVEEGVTAMRRTAIIVIAAIIIGIVGIFAWRTFNPGPLAFAGGSTVALADYHETNPTGVPAGLANADIVKRGEYLAKAADCMVCHTAQGWRRLRRRSRLPGAVRLALFDQHYRRQGHRDRQLQRSGFSRRRATRRSQGWRAALPGHAVHIIHLHDRRRRAGDQGLPVQPARRA